MVPEFQEPPPPPPPVFADPGSPFTPEANFPAPPVPHGLPAAADPTLLSLPPPLPPPGTLVLLISAKFLIPVAIIKPA